jgi:uncharacterized membrane protein YhaH (DUF805 family)
MVSKCLKLNYWHIPGQIQRNGYWVYYLQSQHHYYCFKAILVTIYLMTDSCGDLLSCVIVITLFILAMCYMGKQYHIIELQNIKTN